MSQPITRRHFMERGAALTGALAAAPALSFAEQRPNIILLMGDDHGWEETGYNSHPYLKTPVMDDMAATGLRMDRFYSAAPVCSPTRASVLTGRHPNRCGTFSANFSTRPEETTIAQILGMSGYTCGHFGKWHVGPVKAGSPTNPGAMGFDEWLSHDNFFEMNPTFSRNGGPPEKFEGESSDIVIDETMRFIGKAKQNQKPFFSVIWFGSPHEPYSGVEEDLALYDDLPAEMKERYVRLTSMDTGQPVKRRLDKVLRERFAEITAMDRAMGRLREYLEIQGLRQNTLVWYCGDNGVPGDGRITETLRASKGSVYEGGVRVPGLIEWPAGIRGPRTTGVNTVTSDMLPTICDLAGAPLPERPLDGITLKPLLAGEMTERPTPICFWSYDVRWESTTNKEPYIDPKLQQGTTPLVKVMDGRLTRNFRNFQHPKITGRDFAGPKAILDNRFKLVVGARPTEGDTGPSRELFDVRSDPAEQKDLIQEQPKIAKNLEQELHEWQESVLNSLTGADYR